MSNPRVLVLDDEEELVVTLVERLAIRNIDAEAFTNGHDAIERIHEAAFDVFVADVKMPGLGGLEVIEIVRKRFPNIKIILITGHGRFDEDKDLKVEGVQEVLMKPFSIGSLVTSIRNALGEKQV
jgi:two-component system, OmpR family, response regulator